MEEDEDVDIVGEVDYASKNEQAISNISSGQILSCDYTVHPQWLTDTSDATATWNGNFPKQSSQDEMELVQDEVVIEEPAPIDFNWCEEISNCGDLILEKDIPATIEEEVVAAATYTDTDESFDNNDGTGGGGGHNLSSASSQECQTNDQNCAIIIRSKKTTVRRLNVIGSAHPRSLLKTNYLGEKSQMHTELKFTKTLVVNRNALRTSMHSSKVSTVVQPKEKTIPDTTITKFKHSIKMNKNTATTIERVPFQSKNLRKLSKQLKKRTEAIGRMNNNDKSNYLKCVQTNRSANGKGGGKNHTQTTTIGSGGKGNKRFVDLHGENITINHDVEGCESVGNNANVLVDCLNVVKIDKNCDTDSDLEIDIETDNITQIIDDSHQLEIATKVPPICHENSTKPSSLPLIPPTSNTSSSSSSSSTNNHHKDYPDNLSEIMENLQKPIKELRLDPHTITDLEKYFHSEFFEGRPTKTPERYMKIRTFILDTWSNIKPSYVSKTAIRNGLKNCGDVNCIGRIHSLIEQIGAINFGYDGIQFTYIRPLTELQKWFTQSQIKGNVNGNNSTTSSSLSMQKDFDRRQRTKTSSECITDSAVVDVNYTLRHDDDGLTQLIVTPSSVDEGKSRHYEKRLQHHQIPIDLQLIHCRQFGIDNLAPFKVSITLSTLLCIQLHSLSAKHEVMGFLGGYRSKSVGRNKLSLTRYKPCKTSVHTTTTCEMCPISQVEQSASLIAEGNELLGWFHSHPTFSPNPSRTDVRTQAEMQHQFADKPFIGFILGCIDMKYKCVYILPEQLHNDNIADCIPYSIDVNVINDLTNFTNEIRDVFDVINRKDSSFPIILEKFSTSGNILLHQFGHEKNILTRLKDILIL